MSPQRIYRVYALRDGTVIDHIPRWKGIVILELLGLNQQQQFVTLGIGLRSKRMGWKDVVKIEHRELSEADVMKIALVAPTATLNIIRNHRVAKKARVTIPETIQAIAECPNPKCITNHEPVETLFHRISEKPIILRCHFCERMFTHDEITVA